MAGPAYTVVDRAAAMLVEPVPLADWLVPAPVLLPMLCGALLLMLRHHVRWHMLVSVAGLVLTLAAALALLDRVLDLGPRVMTMGGWHPPFGIAFTADVLGAAFAAMASFVSLACGLYSQRDIGHTEARYGFHCFLMLMVAGVNGAFLTGDLFNLYVWFEVFVIASFGLLVLGSRKTQIDGATKYAILNLLATTLFLVAVALVYGSFGTLNMADLTRVVKLADDEVPLATLSILFLIAFAMKAAAFPLNFWLPASYHTPRIVVGALFGGLLTKVGIYALLRVLGMILPPERAEFSGVIVWVAVATMLLGAAGALGQTDIRRQAGFLVISGVGVMIAGLALGTQAGFAGAIVYAMHSMLAMAALYLVAGEIGARTGSASLHALGGLYPKAPWLVAAAFLVFLGVAGLPPGSGLWPKVVLVKASIDDGRWGLVAAILASGLLSTIAVFRVFALAFWRGSPEAASPQQVSSPVAAAAPPSLMPVLGMAGLVAAILWIGLLPETFIVLADRAAAGLIDPTPYVDAVFPQGGSN
jgi:multicomponent Na+:H+ antiporter subunit D